jgi:hypothetical protein
MPCPSICRIEYLAAPLCQFNEFRCKPRYPIRMILLHFSNVGAADFFWTGTGRNLQNAPPLVLFLKWLRSRLRTFALPLSLGLALLLGLQLTLLSIASSLLPCPPLSLFRL